MPDVDFEEDRRDLIEYVLKVFLTVVRNDNRIGWDACSQTFGPKGTGLGFDPECNIAYVSGKGTQAVYELFLGIEDYVSIDTVQCGIVELRDILLDMWKKEPPADIDHGNGIVSTYFKKEAWQVIQYIEARFELR